MYQSKNPRRPPSVQCDAISRRNDGGQCRARVLLPRTRCPLHGGGRPYWVLSWVPADPDEAARLAAQEAGGMVKEASEPAQEAQEGPPEALGGVVEAPQEPTTAPSPIPPVVEVAKMTPAQLAAHIAQLRGIKGQNGV